MATTLLRRSARRADNPVVPAVVPRRHHRAWASVTNTPKKPTAEPAAEIPKLRRGRDPRIAPLPVETSLRETGVEFATRMVGGFVLLGLDERKNGIPPPWISTAPVPAPAAPSSVVNTADNTEPEEGTNIAEHEPARRVVAIEHLPITLTKWFY